MLAITVPPTSSRFLGQPLTEEYSQSSPFVCEVGNVITAIEEGLEWSLGPISEAFEIAEGDYIREASAKQKLLIQACSFLLQRPVSDREVISSNLLTVEAVDTFFYDFKANPPMNYSPQGEKHTIQEAPTTTTPSAELEALRKENAKLQLEVQQLRREKELVEAQALNSLRRRPTRHNRPVYDSIDDMITSMMREAVAEGIKEALGKGSANV